MIGVNHSRKYSEFLKYGTAAHRYVATLACVSLCLPSPRGLGRGSQRRRVPSRVYSPLLEHLASHTCLSPTGDHPTNESFCRAVSHLEGVGSSEMQPKD